MSDEAPIFCSYTGGPCDQDFSSNNLFKGFFAYPSNPQHLAMTIQEAVRTLQQHSSKQAWKTWEELDVGGQIIFCKICHAMCKAERIVANVTSFNFNVLFELGYAIGLNKPVIPVRDTTYHQDDKEFEQLGIFDVLGYEPFQNSNQLVSIAMKDKLSPTFTFKDIDINRQQPIYYLKSYVDTDGSIKLGSCLKKSALRFRTFDWKETPRLSLHEAYRQISCSVSVIAHLVDPNREFARVHNSLAAFVCGMALAARKHVLLLQEGIFAQPIDYRDLVISYTDHSIIPQHIEKLVRTTADTALSLATKGIPVPRELLEKIDIGDVAAENEIRDLRKYFIRTPQFQQSIQGHTRLVVGRKGSGKTAIFYGVRDNVQINRNVLCLDLKPEGHQFIKLKEMVLRYLSEGTRLHLLTAFWNYLLLLEITKKVVEKENKNAYQDPASLKQYQKLEEIYNRRAIGEEGDFSERLMKLVNNITESAQKLGIKENKEIEITQVIYESDIKELNDVVIEYLQRYDQIWLLFDNIDKGWPTHGAAQEDIEILKCLLEATRKIQRSLQRHEVDLKSIVFIRKDIYDLLIHHTPDRGKEAMVNLEWSDILMLKQLLLKRFQETEELLGDFEQVWTRLFDPHVRGEDSFRYILDRTLQRPRDILSFVRKCINKAISHNHQRVEQEDITTAEKEFSEDMLNDLNFEIRDVFPKYPDIALKFFGWPNLLSCEDLEMILLDTGIATAEIDKVIDILLWFSFLGVVYEGDSYFSYDEQYNLVKLKTLIQSCSKSANIYTIHPGFRAALKTT